MATRSEIFSWYNRAKACDAFALTEKRTNKALGLLLRKDQSWRAKYNPTTKSCGCPDRKFSKEICGHMRAIMIETKIERDKPTVAREYKTLDEIMAKVQWSAGETVWMTDTTFAKEEPGFIRLHEVGVDGKGKAILFLDPVSWSWQPVVGLRNSLLTLRAMAEAK